jgi:hypothetical protein
MEFQAWRDHQLHVTYAVAMAMFKPDLLLHDVSFCMVPNGSVAAGIMYAHPIVGWSWGMRSSQGHEITDGKSIGIYAFKMTDCLSAYQTHKTMNQPKKS